MIHLKSGCIALCLLVTLCGALNLPAQQKLTVISGPWAGNVELRTATVWVEVSPAVKTVAIRFYPKNNQGNARTVNYQGQLGQEFNPLKINLNGLEMNTDYNYELLINNKPYPVPFDLKFRTKDLWQFRKPAPDFTFLTGSCAYFNEPQYDRPGKPYGGDSSIFVTMANTPADFHVWLGDNWYTREVDHSSAWGLNYRASRDRSLSVVQKFMASMPQYAIWDDHDYGPNDEGKSYILKDESRKLFMNYWLNPSFGEDGKGIYTKISYSDVDIFLTDDRYFRSEDNLPDSINGQPNPAKTFLGAAQMDWLKNALVYSKATFKIIAIGSQVLNPLSDFECMRSYSYEYNELMNFLNNSKITGVLFFTGDRHHSEVQKQSRNGLYPLYDVTISPYTSGIGKVRGAELNSPFRIPGTLVEAQNFGKVSVTGKKSERTLSIDFIGTHGEKLGQWSVSEKELR